MDHLRIDKAGERDLGDVMGMIRRLAEYERLEVEATDVGTREAMFGARPAAEAVLARWGGECVGIAVYFETYSTFAGRRGLYLEDLFVRPEWRGKGIGWALMRRVAKEAVARGCGRMEWGVLDWNERAIGFYRELGAEARSEWVKYRLSGDALERLAGGE